MFSKHIWMESNFKESPKRMMHIKKNERTEVVNNESWKEFNLQPGPNDKND